jgi:hypothetical protein
MSSSLHYKCRLVIAGIIISASLYLLPIVYAIEESEVETGFQKFSQKWMNLLHAREKRSKKDLICKKVKNHYWAEYTGYSRIYSSGIKKTDSTITPYIGILKYKEIKFVSHAKTFEGALRGPFTIIHEYPVTELFMFTDGEWHY